MRRSNWISITAWIIAIGVASLALLIGWRELNIKTPALAERMPEVGPEVVSQQSLSDTQPVDLPALTSLASLPSLSRQNSIHTIIPNRPREEVQAYQVDFGDSVFGIAKKFNIQPETVLWANYQTLNDNPDQLTPGMELQIPPVDGVYYQWQEGDTLEAVAGQFDTAIEDILEWPGNDLDLISPELQPGQFVMVPGGHREFRQWLAPTIPRGAAGVSKSLYGPGACDGGYEGAYGTGGFIYPSANHTLSGNDYWSGHLGIDLAVGTGAAIYAADSGVIVFAGWATGGYGYMVMIDHGNGYQTLYAHLSNVRANCGQSVSQGQVIGSAGSTGNSTGSHLHFEVRYQGGFVNPWFVLSAP